MANGQWQLATIYILLNLGFALAACCTVIGLAPTAAGSGIPDLMAYLNNAAIADGFLSFPTFLAKVHCSLHCSWHCSWHCAWLPTAARLTAHCH